MRVSPVRFNYSSKINNKNRNLSANKVVQNPLYNNPSFKADVRVDYESLKSFPEEHQKLIRPILDHAKTAYKDLGNDNMLFSIKPVVTPDKRPKDRFYGISITRTFKDSEAARTSILENNDKDFSHLNRPDINKLRNKDPEIMQRLKIQKETGTRFIPQRLLPQELISLLDSDMEDAVKSMTYSVPKEIVKYKPVSDNYDRW